MKRARKHKRKVRRRSRSLGQPCSATVENIVDLAVRRAYDLDEHDRHFRRAVRFSMDARKALSEGDCEAAGDFAKAAIKLAID